MAESQCEKDRRKRVGRITYTVNKSLLVGVEGVALEGFGGRPLKGACDENVIFGFSEK